MFPFFQRPFIVEFTAPASVMKRILTLNVHLSDFTNIRTVLANKGSELIPLVPQVKPFKPGFFPGSFFHGNNSGTNGTHNIVMRRDADFFSCYFFKCCLHAPVGGNTALEKYRVSDLSVFDDPVDKVQYYRIAKTCQQVFL